jgi:predicted Ser/Thr protein kinase
MKTQKERLNMERFNEQDEQQDQQRKQYAEFTTDRRGYEKESVNVICKW